MHFLCIFYLLFFYYISIYDNYLIIMSSVIIYTYFSSHPANYNLSYFVKKELSYKDNIDYIIVINGYNYDETIQFPNLPNLTIEPSPFPSKPWQ